MIALLPAVQRVRCLKRNIIVAGVHQKLIEELVAQWFAIAWPYWIWNYVFVWDIIETRNRVQVFVWLFVTQKGDRFGLSSLQAHSKWTNSEKRGMKQRNKEELEENLAFLKFLRFSRYFTSAENIKRNKSSPYHVRTISGINEHLIIRLQIDGHFFFVLGPRQCSIVG